MCYCDRAKIILAYRAFSKGLIMYTGLGKTRFIVVSTRNAVFILVLLFIYLLFYYLFVLFVLLLINLL
jgi:hypothetical protein